MRKNCEVGRAENDLASSRNSDVKGSPLKARLSPDNAGGCVGLGTVVSLFPGCSMKGRCGNSRGAEVAGVWGWKWALFVCVCVCANFQLVIKLPELKLVMTTREYSSKHKHTYRRLGYFRG